MLFVVKERLEGLKYNIDFGGGVGVIRRRESQHFYPHFSFELVHVPSVLHLTNAHMRTC